MTTVSEIFPDGRAVEHLEATDAGRHCLLVLGMHRSGTSALTRVLSLLGADLPKTLMPPAVDNNEAGFWESSRFFVFHDGLLNELGSHWSDWRAPDLKRISAVRRQEIKWWLANLIGEEYGTSRFFVLKDPRVSRLLPLYVEVLGECAITPRYVISLRNPLAVAASLMTRDKMTLGYSCLVWLGHVLEAERATRGSARAFVSYESLISDWRPVVADVAQHLDLRWSKPPDTVATEINAFLSPDLQHHLHTENDLMTHPEVADWVKQAFAMLLQMQKNPSAPQAMATLDNIRAALNTIPAVFSEAINGELIERERRLAEALARQALQLQTSGAAIASRDPETPAEDI